MRTNTSNKENTDLFRSFKGIIFKNNKLSLIFIIILFLLLVVVFTTIFKYQLISLVILIVLCGLLIFHVFHLRIIQNDIDNKIDSLHKLIEKKDNFLADFSHRIRTPLNDLPIINDLLENSIISEKQKELLETLIASTNNMMDAVNELTVKSASEFPIESRKKINFNLIKTVENTIELLDLNLQGRAIVNITDDGSLMNVYLGDPVSLKQIFIDIFNLWHSDEDEKFKVDISISKQKKLKNSETIKFLIETNKPVSPAQTGLYNQFAINSLAVKLINLSGGKFDFSHTEAGSKFIFNLSFGLIKEKAVSEVAMRIEKLGTDNKIKKKLSEINLLLVEDNITNRKIVLYSLESIIKNIDTASDGKEALDMFGKSNYDIILMDIQLPIMDGFVASRKIRELESSTNKHTTIIAVTANAMIGDKEKCLSAGIDDYLSKPFQPNKLIELIKKYIASDK